jgi:catechol 2,3-dioxygenase-like lactoylglutathione lyase family enzyme
MNIRHTGIVVRDMEKMVDFYQKMFNLDIVARQIESGSYTDAIFGGVCNARIDVCKMTFHDGGMIELIKHFNCECLERRSGEKIYQLGKMHIAITVESADKMYQRFLDEKCHTLSKPCVSDFGNAKVFFAQDIEGNYLELVEVWNG